MEQKKSEFRSQESSLKLRNSATTREQRIAYIDFVQRTFYLNFRPDKKMFTQLE